MPCMNFSDERTLWKRKRSTNAVFSWLRHRAILVPEEISMQAQEDRRSAMLDLARRWRESGAKARVFAQEHGITAWTLYYWRQRLAQEERPARRRRRSPRRVRLAPVQLVASDGNGHDLEVMLAGGDRIRVPAGISAERLRGVIQVLRTTC